MLNAIISAIPAVIAFGFLALLFWSAGPVPLAALVAFLLGYAVYRLVG